MSVYALLGIPVPRIAYVLLHQPAAGTPRNDYEAVMREMHARLAEESAGLTARRAKLLSEVSNRQGQMLRGALSQFIETPIRSDNAEVQDIFREYFEKFVDQVTERGGEGLIISSEGVLLPGAPPRGLRLPEAAGKHFLRDLSFASGRTMPPVYESVFEIEGGRNLDVLEHLVRDRMGIHTATHGRHVEGNAHFVVSACNRILSMDSQAPPSVLPWGEAVLTFSKPAMTYDDFRASLGIVLHGLSQTKGVLSIAVWQRKLGLGRGNEFVLRCALRSRQSASGLAHSIKECDAPRAVIESIIGHGQFFLREFLPLTQEEIA
jgi:hypothetical protein